MGQKYVSTHLKGQKYANINPRGKNALIPPFLYYLYYQKSPEWINVPLELYCKLSFLEKSQCLKQPLEMFCKKGVFKHFAKFIGKHLCHSFFFNKVAGLRYQACNFIKKGNLVQVFFRALYFIKSFFRISLQWWREL